MVSRDSEDKLEGSKARDRQQIQGRLRHNNIRKAMRAVACRIQGEWARARSRVMAHITSRLGGQKAGMIHPNSGL